MTATDNTSETMRSKGRTPASPAPAATLMAAITKHDDADVEGRTQREIGEKRQRADEAAGVPSQHEEFKRGEARRAQGPSQRTGRRQSVQDPGGGDADEGSPDGAGQEQAKDRVTRHKRRL